MTRYNLPERISDPRVRRRVQRALNFTLAYFDTATDTPWGTRGIDKYFGQQQTPLSKYLRETLLKPVNTTWYFGIKTQTKTYVINPIGAMYIQQLLEGKKPTHKRPKKSQLAAMRAVAVENSFNDHMKEVTSGDFLYELKSNRCFHPLQFLKTVERRPLFAKYGYVHIYDIGTCAPMILLTHAIDHGLPAEYSQPILDYINNRKAIRQHMTAAYGIDVKIIKKLITSWFFGAPLSTYYKSSSMILINNAHTIRLLQSDPVLTELRECIKQLWKTLRNAQDAYGNHIIPRTTTSTSSGKTRLKRISCQDKSNFYMSKELVVMNIIEKYIKRFYHAKIFREHDGFCSDVYVDPAILETHIRNNTAYKIIQFDYELVQSQSGDLRD